ncbi:unnamed protein product [Penicillium olsonii]|nr:unnamed protein product [Penicillium olsonii]CAG8119671.1 unnamed protein product [Penicillium olsonii]
MLYSKDIAQWLKYENFALQSHLCSEWQLIRADQACAFLLEDSKFRSWYEALDSQQLVIFGGMGHGKSVAMAFIAERLSYRGKFRLPQPILCQYYCRDHETGKTTSVLSALTYSLLMQLEGLQKPFHERYKQAQEFHFDPALNAATMEGLLQSMLKTIDRPVIFIIDGMDECDYDSRNRLLKFLKRVLETTLGLKILVSFRHQQEIMEQLTHAAKIELDSSPARDLLIVEKTLEMLPFLSPDVKALITENLSQRAQGSAIWTKMVIELIKMRHLTTKSSIERLLDELPIPEKLSDVYTSIFSRSTGEDHQNWQLAITALKILASSRRALSILELAWAVALSLTREITTVEALQKEVDHQRVMSLIYPFITSPKYDEIRKPQVRLTHQSVKEWVFEQPDLQGSASKMPGQKQDISRKLDSLMLDICVKYLLLDEIGEIDLFSEEQAAFVELPQLSGSSGDDKASLEYDSNCTWETWEDDMARFDPVDRGFGEFFVYASCHWVDHFGRVPAESLSSLASIEKLCQAGSTRLRNWIQQNSRPSCTISPRFEFDSSLYDPLSITSIYGSESILRHMLERSRFESEDFFQESAIKAADQILQWANVSRLEILFLHSQTSAHLQKFELFRLVIKRWSKARFITKPWHKEQQDWDLVFGLVERMLDKMTEEQWGNELLCLAARAGCMPIVHRLVTSAKNKEELRKELFHKTQVKGEKPIIEGSTHRLIGNAILGDHADIVEYLLREKIVEPHFRHRNSLGENVLHLATRLCNPDMFRILIPHFQEGIDERDDQGDVPLVRIVMSPLVSRYEAARSFLLQTSINRDTKSSCWKRDSLRAAVSRLDLDMCCILIWIGKINPVAAFASGDQENVREENNVLSTLIDLFVAEGGNPVELADSREEALQILAEKHYRKCFRAEDPTKPTSSFAQENVLAVQTPIKNSSLATGWSIH